VRKPEPHTWFTSQAGVSFGIPAAFDAWRAGFMPCAAVNTCPKISSETCFGSIPARESAASIATLPSSWAGVPESDPLKAPTGVRAAPTITTPSAISCSSLIALLGPERRFPGRQPHSLEPARASLAKLYMPYVALRHSFTGIAQTGSRTCEKALSF
jgi:hypothetical protein